MSTGSSNLVQDPTGVLSRYYQCSIVFWNIASNFLDVIIGLTTTTTAVLAGLTQYNDFSADVESKIGIATIVTASVSAGCHILKVVANNLISEDTSALQQVTA